MLAGLHALRLQQRRLSYAETSACRLPASACEVALAMVADCMGSPRYVEHYLRTVAETKCAKRESACTGYAMEEPALTELVSRCKEEVGDRYRSWTQAQLQENSSRGLSKVEAPTPGRTDIHAMSSLEELCRRAERQGSGAQGRAGYRSFVSRRGSTAGRLCGSTARLFGVEGPPHGYSGFAVAAVAWVWWRAFSK